MNKGNIIKALAIGAGISILGLFSLSIVKTARYKI